MTLRVGLVGVGIHGQFLLDACDRLPDVEVHCVYDPDPTAIGEATRRRGVAVTDSYAAVLADPKVDAVFVATPSERHSDHAKAALDAGKHVLVEKPLADTLDGACAVVEAAARAGTIVMVDHSERFCPAFIEAGHMVRNGAIGELRVVHSTRLSPLHLNRTTWKLGVLETAVHNLDLSCLLMDADPIAVSARSARVNPDLSIDDNVWISLEFPGGRRAEDHMGWLSMDHYLMPVAHPRFLLMGTEGFYSIDLWQRAGLLYRGEQTRYVDDVLLGTGDGYLSTLAGSIWHFARAVARGGPSPVPASVGLRAVRIALAAQESMQCDGKRIELPCRR